MRSGYAALPAILAAVIMSSACGGSNAQSSARLGPAGGVVKTDNVRLDVPPGALSAETVVAIRETSPSGIIRRVDIEPRGLALLRTCRINVRGDGAGAPVKVVAIGDGGDVSPGRLCSATNWHSGDLSELTAVELRQGKACNPTCDAGLVCEEGSCVAPDAFCAYCGPACSPAGCDGWMCGCNGGTCGCHLDAGTCCDGTTCCQGPMCCNDATCGSPTSG